MRPIANYGMPNHLRVTIGRPQENERFLAALWVACRRSGAGRARLVAVGGLTLAACLAKEIGAVTPVVLLSYNFV